MIGLLAVALGIFLAQGAWAQGDPFVIDSDGPPPPMRELAAAMFAPYSHTLAALAGWALLMIVLMGLSTMGEAKARTEGGPPVRDYSDPAYRRYRAHMNAVESAGPFVAAALGAMLVGAPPFWVNLLALVFLAARIAMAAVHIGTENQPARSACFTLGLLCVFGLALLALFGAFGL